MSFLNRWVIPPIVILGASIIVFAATSVIATGSLTGLAQSPRAERQQRSGEGTVRLSALMVAVRGVRAVAHPGANGLTNVKVRVARWGSCSSLPRAWASSGSRVW